MQALSRNKLKLFTSLSLKKQRYQQGYFIVEGKKMVQEAFQSNWELEAIVFNGGEDRTWIELLEAHSVPIFYTDAQSYSSITKLQNPEGILAVVKFPTPNFGKSHQLESLPEGNGIILDALQDPGNLGTIMRTMDWFGLKNLICGSGTVDFLNPKCLRSSMGAVFRTEIVYVPDIKSLLETDLSRIWLADMEGVSLSELELKQNDYVVIGNEARGISTSLKQIEGISRLHIPGKGGTESLNAAVSAAIVAWNLCYS